MLHGVITMAQANRAGVSRRKVYRLVRAGEWLQLHEGVFLTNVQLALDARWKAELAGLLLRCGEGAIVSHGAAAVLHRLEGITGRPVDVTVFSNSNRFPEQVHRSRVPDPKSVVIDGLLTGSLSRTIREIASDHNVEVVEQAIESALRGPDPRRPDVWNTALLAELRAKVADHPRLAGNYRLKAVLQLRTDVDRPTGSFPETLLFQSLRAIGLTGVRQPTLRIRDPAGIILDTFFPDIALPHYRLLIEVDGAGAHANASALTRDLRRQNKVLRGFRLLRFPATDILRDPVATAQQVERAIRETTPLTPAAWTVDGVSVAYATNEFEVVDRSR